MKIRFLPKKRLSPLFPIGFSALVLLSLQITLLPPSAQVDVGFFSFSTLYVFFFLLFVLLFAMGTLTFRTRMHGFLFAMFIISYLLLRLNDLTHPLFLVLLIAFFVALEFFFSQSAPKRENQPKP